MIVRLATFLVAVAYGAFSPDAFMEEPALKARMIGAAAAMIGWLLAAVTFTRWAPLSDKR